MIYHINAQWLEYRKSVLIKVVLNIVMQALQNEMVRVELIEGGLIFPKAPLHNYK